MAASARAYKYYGVAMISRLLKLQASFAEYRLFYRALLQKRHIILRSLLIVATPYQHSLILRSNYTCRVQNGKPIQNPFARLMGENVDDDQVVATYIHTHVRDAHAPAVSPLSPSLSLACRVPSPFIPFHVEHT